MPDVITASELPPEIVSEIRRLLIQGVAVERIVAYLRAMSGATTLAEADLPSRSALGRYALRSKSLRDKLTTCRALAVATAEGIGIQSSSAQMSILTELLQSHIFDFMMPEDGPAPDLTPKSIGELAKSLKDITTALRGNIEFMRAAEQLAADRATKLAAEKLERGLATAEGEAAASLAPQTPAQIIARIRSLYAGEG
ncbi:MAG: DUF3486 family protein, partial [Tardiphaga sp.]|nr:DUF3486 family protein [Tardiphaga sp.]